MTKIARRNHFESPCQEAGTPENRRSGWPQVQQPASRLLVPPYASTSRTLWASTSGENGFWRKRTASYKRPYRNRTFIPGGSGNSCSASRRPPRCGTTTSVTSKWLTAVATGCLALPAQFA